MRHKVILVGAGGHAKVVSDILLSDDEYEVAGYIDCDDTKAYRGIKVIGKDEDLERFYREGIKYAFISIGCNNLRKKLQKKCLNIGYEIINVISPKAWISPTAILGRGNVVMTGAIIHADTVIGDGCIVNTNASIDHDCRIMDYCHIAPGSTISGYTRLGENCFLGTGSRVIDKIKIGNNVIVGAGGVVIRDVSANTKIAGVPAEILKK